MPKSRKKKRALPAQKVASIYNDDIGLEGLKKKRISYTDGISFHLPIDEQEEKKRRKRMQRFVEHNEKKLLSKKSTSKESTFEAVLRSKSSDIFETNETFVGKSTALEKPYMRLTSAPKAEDVRPLVTLRAALSHVKAHFVENEDFDFANEQLKSIRQDITVQHLRNKFVLEVYETHSRILLEHGDLNEFNQCQTMIRSLTGSPDLGLTTSSTKDKARKSRKKARTKYLLRQSEEASDEFRAYSLLYDVVQNSWCDLAVHLASEKRNSIGTRKKSHKSTDSMKRTNEAPITRGSSVRHAMKVVNAIIHDDYLSFFRLYDSADRKSVV